MPPRLQEQPVDVAVDDVHEEERLVLLRPVGALAQPYGRRHLLDLYARHSLRLPQVPGRTRRGHHISSISVLKDIYESGDAYFPSSEILQRLELPVGQRPMEVPCLALGVGAARKIGSVKVYISKVYLSRPCI